MKKMILFFLPVLYLSSSTELHELLRIPQLLVHYAEHRKADPPLTFLDFLAMHYSPGHTNDNDSKDDNQLPFKSKGSLAHIDNPTQPAPLTPQPTCFPRAKETKAPYSESIPGMDPSSVFHPPRHG